MNTPSPIPGDTFSNSYPEWYEGFPEPQTIPSGWDLSGLKETILPAVAGEPDRYVEEVAVRK
jgi:hypothetical protein